MTHDLARRAIAAYARGDRPEAERLARERLAQAPEDEDALALLDDLALDEARAESPDGFDASPAGAPSISDGFASVGGPPPVRASFGDLRVDDGARPQRGAPILAAPLAVIVAVALHAAAAFVLGVLAVALLFARLPLAPLVALLLAAGAGALALLARGLARRSRGAWALALALQAALAVLATVAVVEEPTPGASTGLVATLVVAAALVAARREIWGRGRADPSQDPAS